MVLGCVCTWVVECDGSVAAGSVARGCDVIRTIRGPKGDDWMVTAACGVMVAAVGRRPVGRGTDTFEGKVLVARTTAADGATARSCGLGRVAGAGGFGCTGGGTFFVEVTD